MKNILAQLTANNQVLFRYVDRSDSLKTVDYRDKAATREATRLSLHVCKVEQIDRLLTHTCKEYKHTNISYIYAEKEKSGQICTSALPIEAQCTIRMPCQGLACDLTGSIEYFDEDELKVVKTNYRLLTTSKRRHLDIIRKSQQPPKKHQCWGAQQSKKQFTNNARQKILEAGAIVDCDTSLGDQYEVTLTIPGSGNDVFCAIANWSGYIVNRLTQIIRRWERKGCPVYWFFVWEHQKRGALHMHWCIAIPGEPMLADFLARQIQGKWFDLLGELSVKTGIDLFKKRGFSGTWADSPDKWQSNIAPVRKSVAAYFSKYCTKNIETRKHNDSRRERYAHKSKSAFSRDGKQGTLSMYPSRYWGSCSRIKDRCREYRVDVLIPVSTESEGHYVKNVISDWVSAFGDFTGKVSRLFKVASAENGFIYAQGWEERIWFRSDVLGCVKVIFDLLRHAVRAWDDKIAGLCNMVAIEPCYRSVG